MIYTYARVSTARQADDGESLDVQHRMMAGYALMKGWKVDTDFVDRGVSGSVPLGQRPEGASLLACVRRGDIILTAKLDRMFRSSLDALAVLSDLQTAGIALHMIDLGGDVTGNGIGKLVFAILAAVAEAERDRTRERILDVKADQRARGAYLGGKVPFGYRVVAGMLHPDDQQQAMCERIRMRHASGESLRAIKAALKLNLSLDAISRICRPT
ncbi:MAG TPA: recombinase family protein [Acetobacteraceae bacterium]|jgi:putative DNA-invertase from lambdoid prophage Rac|nr:recombinase family protein [Acetobacteraceae bacterium]